MSDEDSSSTSVVSSEKHEQENISCKNLEKEKLNVNVNYGNSSNKTDTSEKDYSVKTVSESGSCVSDNKDSDQSSRDADKTTRADLDSSNITYEGDKCIYIDPNTKYRYVWDPNKNDWIAEQQSQVPSNWDANNSDYRFDGTTYTYTDKNTKVEYKWDTNKNEWLPLQQQGATTSDNNESSDSKTISGDTTDEIKKGSSNSDSNSTTAPSVTNRGGVYGYENDTHTYTDPSDNTVYIWDRDKNAWFPKVDDDFLAHYQMNYGFVDTNKSSSEEKKSTDESKLSDSDKSLEVTDIKGEKRKAQQQEPTWFEVDEQSNTKVYVSNLPLDISEKEFVDLMQKCGLVMKDVDTNKMKIKLYTEPGTTHLKGDGLCTYIKKESVELALNLLDGYDVRGHKLHVERARFTMKGDAYDPSLKPKKRKKKDKEKLKKMQEKLFDWRPDKLRGERSRNESVVIVKNLFEPSIFDKDVKLILEFQQDIRDECQKLGAVKRVIIYDRHPEGVAQINFKEPEAADACVQLLNGRWFNKRRITAETWDGKTKYKIIETEEELKKRIDKWDSFLHAEEENAEKERKQQMENKKSKNETAENTNAPGVEDKGIINKKEEKSTSNIEEFDSDDTRSSVGSNDS